MLAIVPAFILHAGSVSMQESGILKRFNFFKVICISSISLSSNIRSWLFLHTAIKFITIKWIPTNITKNISLNLVFLQILWSSRVIFTYWSFREGKERRSPDCTCLAQEILDILLRYCHFYKDNFCRRGRSVLLSHHWISGFPFWQSYLFCTSVSALEMLTFYHI